MTSSAFKKIMWGVLLSGCHLIIENTYQILPAFLGYIIVWIGVKELCRNGYEAYYSKVERSALIVFILSVGTWIAGLFIGYTLILALAVMVCFYLIELMLYADLLSANVKLLKDSNKIKEANLMRKNRAIFLKAFLVLIIVCCVQMAGQALKWKYIFVLDYAILTFMLFMKIWLSMFIQNMSGYEINLHKNE